MSDQGLHEWEIKLFLPDIGNRTPEPPDIDKFILDMRLDHLLAGSPQVDERTIAQRARLRDICGEMVAPVQDAQRKAKLAKTFVPGRDPDSVPPEPDAGATLEQLIASELQKAAQSIAAAKAISSRVDNTSWSGSVEGRGLSWEPNASPFRPGRASLGQGPDELPTTRVEPNPVDISHAETCAHCGLAGDACECEQDILRASMAAAAFAFRPVANADAVSLDLMSSTATLQKTRSMLDADFVLPQGWRRTTGERGAVEIFDSNDQRVAWRSSE